jgi:hypothetical protein
MFKVPYILVMYMLNWSSNYMYMYLYVFFISSFLTLHVSGAICTYPQERKLQRTAIGVCNGFGMLTFWHRNFLNFFNTPCM